MKKHSFAMVFLLIVALSLIGAVSASDNITACDDGFVSVDSDEVQIEVEALPEEEVCMSEVELEEVPSEASQSEADDACEPVEAEVSYDDYTVESDCDYDSYVCEDCEIEEQSVSQIETPELEQEDIQTPQISVENVDLQSDNDYHAGYGIMTALISPIDFSAVEDVMVFTNAGESEINSETTKDVLNGIINASNGYIKKDNLKTLSFKSDSLIIMICVKTDESLTIAIYNRGSAAHLHYGNTSPENIVSCWNNLKSEEFSNSLANGLLDESDLVSFRESLTAGLESGQNWVLENYPIKDLNLPLGNALSVSRDFDDDAFICKSINASDEKASVAVDMVNESAGLKVKSADSESTDFEQIGVDATRKALAYFKSLGIDIQNDYPYLYVFTSAGYVYLSGQSTDRVLDGILKGLGPKFDRRHLISTDALSKKDLVFYFIYTNMNRMDFKSYAFRYDGLKFVASDDVKRIGDELAYDMGLYEKHHYEPPQRHCPDYYVPENTAQKQKVKIENRTVKNATNATHKANVTLKANRTNESLNSTDENLTELVGEERLQSHVNPFNIIYTIISVLIVCFIFGVSYRKR